VRQRVNKRLKFIPHKSYIQDEEGSRLATMLKQGLYKIDMPKNRIYNAAKNE